MDIRVAENGRMILPQSVRKAMGLSGEAKVILTLENDEVRLTPIGHGVARARALYRQHAKSERTNADFLADRREEVAFEDVNRRAKGTPDRRGTGTLAAAASVDGGAHVRAAGDVGRA